jgi:DNA-binding NtrC family response regulator
MLVRVIVAASRTTLRDRLLRCLHRPELVVTAVSGGRALLDRAARGDFDLLLAARAALPADVAGFIASVRALPERPEVIVTSGREDPAERAALLTAGCMAVINEALPDGVVTETLQVLVERKRDEAIRRLRAERPEEQYSLDDFISLSPSMQAFLQLARRVVDTDSSLLILGETGVGKERLARAIQGESPRGRGPFVPVNCGAIPEYLIESELFGHEEGAFTGATRARRGYFEVAHRGTVFLDEIGDLPLHLQVKLLRVLESREIQRVGGEKPLRVDVRVIASTNRQLEEEVAARRFRSDLYYRLAVVTLLLPPLRERREDIPQLVASYIDHFRVLLRHPVRGIGPAALEALVRYNWPGNVRELINVLERTLLLCAGPEITPEDLPDGIAAGVIDTASPPPPGAGSGLFSNHAGLPPPGPLREERHRATEAFEREYLRQLLSAAGGRVGESARLAGINVRSLYELMKRHGLNKESFRVRIDTFRG